jgi:hypothetical protein
MFDLNPFFKKLEDYNRIRPRKLSLFYKKRNSWSLFIRLKDKNIELRRKLWRASNIFYLNENNELYS